MIDAVIVSSGLAACVTGLVVRAPGTGAARLASAMGGRDVALARRRARRRGLGLSAFAAAACWLAFGTLATIAFAMAAAAVTAVSARAQRRRRETSTRAGVIEMLRAFAAELRSGRATSSAFHAAAEASAEPLRTLLRPAADIALRGDPDELTAAVEDVAAASPVGGRALDGLNRLVACWRVSATSGAMLAPAIDRVADALHDEIELARALATSLAGPRATMRLLAALPLAGLLLGSAIGARPVAFLLGSPGGLGCLFAAAIFDLAGIMWGRRIASRALRFE